jgi:hypothetical protein
MVEAVVWEKGMKKSQSASLIGYNQFFTISGK